MPPSIPLEEYKDLIIGLYQEGKSWRTIGGILRNEYGLQLNANTVRQRCIEWKVEVRGRVQLSDSLEQRVKELWADPKTRPTDDQELCRKLKAEGFKVTLSGICKLRKRLKLYRRYDEKLGRLRPDSELRGRKRHVQKVSYADYVAAQLASPAPVADAENYNSQNVESAQGQAGQYQYGINDHNDNAQGLATLAAAIQVDANGRPEENNANAKEPETTPAVFQLEDDSSSDEGDDDEDEDEDEDEEESETSDAGIDHNQGGQSDDDDPVIVDNDESDDGNGPQDGDSGQAIAAAEDHSQEPTQQDEPTPNEWYSNEHPGLTLADLPSPKLPKRSSNPPKKAGPRGLYQKTRDRLAAYAAAFPAEFRSYLPEGHISQPQIPLAAPYSDRERGKDARIVALQQRIQLLEEHCIANEIGLPGEKPHRNSKATEASKRRSRKSTGQERNRSTAVPTRGNAASANQAQTPPSQSATHGRGTTTTPSQINGASTIPAPYVPEAPTQPYMSEAYTGQLRSVSAIPQPYIPHSASTQLRNASNLFLQRGYGATNSQSSFNFSS